MRTALVLGIATVLLVSGSLERQVREWDVQLEARIGSVNDPEQSLTWVSQVLIGPNGRLFVAQPQDQRIRVFDQNGKLERTIGRRGQGPGEFGAVSAIGFRHDTLYVADNSTRRLSYFLADGTFLESRQVATPMIGSAPPEIYFPTVPQLLLSDGTALVKPEVPVALMASGTGKVPYLHVDREGQVIDTVSWEALPLATFEIRSGGTSFYAAKPFPETPLFHLLADGSGLIVVERASNHARAPDQFRVVKIGVSGDTVFSRAYPFEPVRLSSSASSSALDRIEARLARRPNPPSRREIEQTLRRLNLIPEYAVPVDAVASASDGSIWLKRESDGSGTNLWQILTPEGTLEGTVRLPGSQSVLAVTGRMLVTLELDSLDVPYVLRHGIRRQ